MSEQTKSAYRHLLYIAMIDIRNRCQPRGDPSANPIAWYLQYRRSRVAGATADWLHNLAMFSTLDFTRFDEQRFWSDHALLCRQYPGERLDRYREVFALHLEGDVRICL